MHSRIFKLQNNLDEEYRHIREADFEDNGFLDGYHDYVAEQNQEEELEDYKWLITCYGDIFKNFRSEIAEYDTTYYVDVYKEDLKNFLIDILEKAKKQIEEMDYKRFDFYELICLVRGDMSGFYFYLDGCYYTNTQFFTELYNYYFKGDNDKITFRLEGTLDYHS